MNTKRVGNITELQCITRLYELGHSVSIPFGNADKYDFILDINGKLFKVQCKHANEKRDETGEVAYIQLKTTWQSHNSHGWVRNQYTADDIDFFATFYQGNCYLIPIDECTQTKVLRLKSPKNGQIHGVNFISDYLAEKIIAQL